MPAAVPQAEGWQASLAATAATAGMEAAEVEAEARARAEVADKVIECQQCL